MRDHAIAGEALRGEEKAIGDYTREIHAAGKPKLKRALAANRKDEHEHATRLRGVRRGLR